MKLLALALACCCTPAYPQQDLKGLIDHNRGRVGGPDTTLPALQAYSAAKTRCPSLLKLDNDTAALDADTMKVSDRAATLSARLDTLADRLAIPGQLAKALGAVETQLVAIQKGAKLAEGTQYKAKAKKLDDSATAALVNVRAAKAKAEAVAKAVEPARKAAEKISGYSGKTAAGLKTFSETVLKHEPDVTYCVQFAIAYNSDPVKTCVQDKADDLSARLDPRVLQADAVMKALLTDLDPKVPALTALENFNLDLDAVVKLKADTEALEKRLKPLCDALKKLEDRMDDGFTVSIPYLVGSYDITVSMKTILEGSAAITDYIEKKVSGAVWSAAKAFGLGKLVDKLSDKAKSAIDAILGAVNFTPDLSLSTAAITNLEPKVPGLNAAFPGSFSVPELDMNRPDFGLPHVPAGLDLRQFLADLKAVSPSCASGTTTHLTSFTFGCAK